tara:strand:- start:1017 stop:1262 length:246 start_codon:yes stop_codon:yes gene_type:complete
MINPRALALSLGIFVGGALVVLGWIASFGWLENMVNAIGTVYLGYQPGFIGGLIGGLWGLIDWAIGGYIFGLLYNWASQKS